MILSKTVSRYSALLVVEKNRLEFNSSFYLLESKVWTVVHWMRCGDLHVAFSGYLSVFC